MRTRRLASLRLVLLGVLCLAAPVMQAAGGSCAFRVDDVSGVTTPWPLVGGLPLPVGALRDPGGIRIVDDQGREVPAQVDVAATYRDGSIRWALVSLVGPVTGSYRAEYGPAVTRAAATGIALTEKGDDLVVDTGAAVFTFSRANLLPDTGRLAGGTVLWGPGEATAYLIDNQGRRALCGGAAAAVERRVLKRGPLRCVVRTEGWYVTSQGERVARGSARLSFFAGSAMVQVSHTLVLTEDTNAVWVRDYGLEFSLRAVAPTAATFDVDKAFDAAVRSVSLTPGEAVSMLQDDYPHFLETGSHFALTRLGAGSPQELLSGAVCGDWCDASSGQAGLTVVVRDLAEQFPKELEVSTEGVRVHFWPARCGREWDFRTPTLIREYWGQWIQQGLWSQNGRANRVGEVAKTPSNAQGSAKTHEVWLVPHVGPLDPVAAARQAHAVCRPVLLQAAPAFLCASGALGWPLHPKDEKRFPTEEAILGDFFERIILPYRVFPLTGLIEWGSCPYLDYEKQAGRWTADFYRTAWSVEYGVRRHVWGLYARSGERRYYEYGSRFNTHCADWDMAHWDAPPDVVRGGFGYSYGRIHEPLHWRGPKSLLQIDNSGHDVVNWLLEYYLTGNEAALEATREYGEALKQGWVPETATKSYAPFVLLRVLAALYTREWDPAFRQMVDDLAAGVVDLAAPNGLSKDLNAPYGPLYKVDRSALVLYDTWWATGEERFRQAFLKAMDYQYRFNHVPPPTSYQNAGAFLFAIAYEWTGREEYLGVVDHLVQTGVRQEARSLVDDLQGTADLSALTRLPYRGAHTNMHYLLGTPTALGALAKTATPLPPWPVLASPRFATEAVSVAFEKPTGQAVSLSVFAAAPGETPLQVLDPEGRPAQAEVRVEERLPFRDWELPGQGKDKTAPRPSLPAHIEVRVPAEAPAGTYRLAAAESASLTVQHASVDRVFLACPEGLWLAPDGQPAYFTVPAGTESLRLYANHPVTLVRADGSAALDEKGGQLGEIVVPVGGQAGVWSVRGRARGGPPVPFSPHLRFLNVPAVVAAAPGALPRTPPALPPPAPAWVPPPGDFAAGVAGQALHFSSGRTLRFPRGALQSDGSYERFPTRQGTIEFWFRPDWSSAWLTLAEGQTVRSDFVRGGAIDLHYRYGFGPWRDNFYAHLDLLTRGVLGKAEEKKRDEIGGMARTFFRAGEWVHLAAVWAMTDGKTGTTGDFAIYVNGRRQPRTWEYPFALTGRDPYVLREVAPTIVIGCREGWLDELRISRVARYAGDFTPARLPLVPDADALALFRFDGTTEGLAGADARPFAAELQPGKP